MSPTVTEHQKRFDGCWWEPSPIGGTIAHGWCELDGFGAFEKISGNKDFYLGSAEQTKAVGTPTRS